MILLELEINAIFYALACSVSIFSICRKMRHQLNDSTDYILKYHLIKLMMVVFVYQNLQIIKQLETNNTVKVIQYCNNTLITLKLHTFNQYSQQFTWSVMYLWIERKGKRQRKRKKTMWMISTKNGMSTTLMKLESRDRVIVNICAFISKYCCEVGLKKKQSFDRGRKKEGCTSVHYRSNTHWLTVNVWIQLRKKKKNGI